MGDGRVTGMRGRCVGVVSQEPVLFSGSIADNIRYGLPGGPAAASDAAIEAAARQAHSPSPPSFSRHSLNTQRSAAALLPPPRAP